MKSRRHSREKSWVRLFLGWGRSEWAVYWGVVWLCAVMGGAAAWGSDVALTKHNLTATGPGGVKTSSVGESCRFCHTPHASSPLAPLWNRQDPGSYYTTYESPTLEAVVGQPTGTSRLCLSCHDGTIALTQVFNAADQPAGGAVYISAADRGYLGTDLSDDHPISFSYDSALALRKGQLRDPALLSKRLPLDRLGQLQCTTCHDPHDDSYGKFLRMSNTASAMCVSCHEMTDWPLSAHAKSTASLAGATRDRWSNLSVSNVRDAGCGSCHRPHSAGGRHWLQRQEAEESNCYACHDGTVAKTDLTVFSSKISRHSEDVTTGVHRPNEQPGSMMKHVECSDCHDPHRMGGGGSTVAPNIQPAMYGAVGVDASGRVVDPARYEYEVCFKCHSQQNFAGSGLVNRQFGNGNIADEFSTANKSYHPVMAAGKGNRLPSLLPPYSGTSVIYCTSCHGSDSSTTAKGPHGSGSRPMLTGNYTVGDNMTESQTMYAACYKCHDRNTILSESSGTFKYHKKHVQEKRTPCSVCHDPHGVAENAHLINFDTTVVKPVNASTPVKYTTTTTGHGTCTLRCHNETHNNESY